MAEVANVKRGFLALDVKTRHCQDMRESMYLNSVRLSIITKCRRRWKGRLGESRVLTTWSPVPVSGLRAYPKSPECRAF